MGSWGGCLGGPGIGEGGAGRTTRNGSGDGLAVSVVFKSIVCPFLYTVNVILSPADLCWSIYDIHIIYFCNIMSINTYYYVARMFLCILICGTSMYSSLIRRSVLCNCIYIPFRFATADGIPVRFCAKSDVKVAPLSPR